MLCERCKKNQAIVHMSQIINGEARQVHLCQECATALEFLSNFSFQNMFQDLFNLAAGSMGQAEEKTEEKLKCPNCALTYETFMRTGKLGCEGCYNTFFNNLQSTLKNIHGSNEHKGKIPQRSGGRMIKKRNVDTLKRELALAIEKEEYEEAAKIRDRIRDIGKEV